MRIHQMQYRDESQLCEWIVEQNIRDSSQLLVQIYSYSEETSYISRLIGLLTRLFPQAAVMGCTTPGEIMDGDLYENTTVLSFMEFERTSFRTVLLGCTNGTDGTELGRKVAEQLYAPDAKAFILFTSMLSQLEAFVKTIEEAAPQVVLAGGISGSSNCRTVLYSKEGIVMEGVVGISLCNPELHVHQSYSLNWKQVGRSFTVTHAVGNRVYSIDNMSVLDLYAKYLGDKISKKILDKSEQFPFLLERDGMEIGRDVVAINSDGSVTVSGNLYNGETVRLGFGDPELIMESSRKLIRSFDGIPAEAVLVFSCEARRRFIFDVIHYELAPLKELGPSAGFFTFGEFYHHQNKNLIINHSMTLLILSENAQVERSHIPGRELLAEEWEGLDALKAMAHLAQVSTEELVLLNKSLEASEQRYKSLVQYNPDIVYSIDNEGSFLSVNHTFYEMLDYSASDEVSSLYQVILPRDEWIAKEAIRQAFMGNPQTFEMALLKKDRSSVPFVVTKIPIIVHDEIVGVYGIAKNISERKEAEKRITYMAYHDVLTELPNRTLFYKRVAELINVSEKNQSQFAVLFLDLDNFKDINDTYGHFAGDLILKQVAVELKRLLHGRGTAARFGGDEFAVALEIGSMEEAEAFAKQVLQYFDEPVRVEDKEHFVTVSVGLSLYPQDSQDAEVLLKNADLAMYQAKQSGKNRFTYFSRSISEQTREKRGLASELRKAIQEEELQVYYQPLVDLRSGRMFGSEALVRWFHKERGAIPPSLFIPIAEENGLIDALGYWVLKTACAQHMQWISRYRAPLIISVNVSSQQFQRSDFVEVVEEVLESSGLKPELLHLEITESTALWNIEHTKLILRKLQRLGVSISMDDFGIGYSSLSCVKDLSIDKLKIDRSFITNISTMERDAAIVKTIIALSRNLNMKVLAEGVETREQLELLASYECDEIQGYLFSPPVSAVQFEESFLKSLYNSTIVP